MKKTFAIHHHAEPHPFLGDPDPHHDTFSRSFLGFWIYLMTDCLIFACLFATYAVLHNNTFGGPSSQELFDLTSAFAETMILLTSTVTCGFGMLAAVKENKNHAIGWFSLTFLLGASFIAFELHEFYQFAHEGNSWQESAFLSSFFTLVGTHGLHVSFGLLWMAVMIVQLYWQGVTINTFRRLVLLSLFWHFLDLIWIFIFTFVYLMGVI
jgi:cytochrome o ubiquinol oxidase subunit 3